MSSLTFLYGATIVCWVIFAVVFIRDRSRYRNCLILFVTLLLTLWSVLLLAGERAIVAALLLILLALLLVPVFLIWNGIVMIKKEGVGKSTLLSLAFGIIIGLGEISTFFLMVQSYIFSNTDAGFLLNEALIIVILIISMSVIYGSLSFLMFMIYSIFLMLIPRKRDFDYVIIHGAGLAGGEKVTKLLADRVDKAIQVYHKDPTPPFLIPSGGQGSDEKISEAEAMKRYLLEKGIPEDKILMEDKSTTTLENLANSQKIIEAQGGRTYTALVTSNYHVYRALRYCRKIGLKCTGIGSHVAFYYWPSALIREYVAVHAEKKHAVIFFLGWLIFLLPAIVMLLA